ncbi:MAG: FG-GAP-like repeat-containing protein [Bryobacteraceae bacterium]|jgi:uncharacterized protein (TIGR03437 family)
MRLNMKPTFLTLALLAAFSPARAQFSPSPNNPFFSGHNPVAIVAKDFNNDTIPDLAVANQTDNTVTILIGDGLGNFSPANTGFTGNGVFRVGSNPSAIASADFNNDGKPDLAVANINDGTVTVLFGDNAGNFPNRTTLTVGKGTGPTAIAVADFNGDGNPDIATANLDAGSVTIFFGDGSGGFPRSITIDNTGSYPIAMVAADLNFDGIPDIAVANEGDGSITVLLDPGTSAAQPPRVLRSSVISDTPAVTQSVSGIVAANFTGHPPASNGLPIFDLAVTYYDNTSFLGNLLLFTADGTGWYNPPSSPFFAKSIGMQPIAIAMGDFAVGWNPGVAIVNYRSDTAAVYAGDGMGHLNPSMNSPYATGSLPRAIAAADFNGDGLTDIAVANYNDGTVTVLLNGFATAPSMLSAASNASPVSPDSLVTIYGTGLSLPSNPQATALKLTDASGVVWPMTTTISYSCPTQLNALVPANAATGAGSFTVTAPGETPQKASVTINAVAPGLFSADSSGKGPAAGYVQSLIDPTSIMNVFSCSAPPPPPSVSPCSPQPLVCTPNPISLTDPTSLVLYATGLGDHIQLSSIAVTVGTTAVTAFYAAAVPGMEGVDQINVILPSSLAHAGTVYVQLAIGSATSNQVTINIL